MVNNQHNDFENRYGGGANMHPEMDYRKGSRAMGKGMTDG